MSSYGVKVSFVSEGRAERRREWSSEEEYTERIVRVWRFGRCRGPIDSGRDMLVFKSSSAGSSP
jgi:hypothetical protein